MMIRTRTMVFLSAMAFVPAGVATAQSSDFQWSDRIDQGRTVRISNVNGTVTVRAGGGDRVEVTAVKRWRRGDPASVRIHASRQGGDVRVCPLYQDQDDCDDRGPRDDRRRRDRDDWSDVSVDFTISVPRGVHVVAASVNGPVSVTGATEDIEASTVNGNVSIESGRGRLTASTVSGTVRATIVTRPSVAEFNTVNGSVIAELASNIGADIEMTSVNGSLQSDYEIVVRNGRFNPFNVAAHIGPSGGPRMRFTTVNGNVELRKR